MQEVEYTFPDISNLYGFPGRNLQMCVCVYVCVCVCVHILSVWMVHNCALL